MLLSDIDNFSSGKMVSCDTSEGLTLTLYTAISLQTCVFLEGLKFVLAAIPAVVVVVSDAGVSVLLVFMLVVL